MRDSLTGCTTSDYAAEDTSYDPAIQSTAGEKSRMKRADAVARALREPGRAVAIGLTRAPGVSKMRPKMVLYMVNMLHMWSWKNDMQPTENAVGYVLARV